MAWCLAASEIAFIMKKIQRKMSEIMLYLQTKYGGKIWREFSQIRGFVKMG